MEQKDFILREIEKITVLIQFLLGRYKPSKSINEFREIEKTLFDEFKDKYEKELDHFLNIDKNNFEKELNTSSGFSDENIELLADLFLTLGSDKFSNNQFYLNRALELYEYVDLKSKTFSMERTHKINSIRTNY